VSKSKLKYAFLIPAHRTVMKRFDVYMYRLYKKSKTKTETPGEATDYDAIIMLKSEQQ